MPYDLNGQGVDRNDRPPFLVFVVAFALALVIFFIALALTPEARPSQKLRHDSLSATLTNDGTYIRWYVFVDPDSGVEYLVNDRGGATPRLDKDGELIVVM